MRELSTNKLIGQAYYAGWGENRKVYTSITYFREGEIYINYDSIDFSNFDTYEIPAVTEIPETAKLIFHKTSKFPRHKLQTTKYVRKIKESLAEFIVGNYKKPALTYNKTRYSKAFISDSYIILTQDSTITLDQIKASNVPLFINEDFNIVENYNLLHLSKEEKLYIEYMEGEHKIPIITDETLNRLTDNYSEILTPEDLTGVIQLIKSGDKDNIALGAKLFCQFNLSAMPAFTRIFLMYYHTRIHYTPAGTSVVYKNLVDNFKVLYRSDQNIARVLSDNPPGKEERELIKMIILDEIVSDVERKIEGYNKTIKNLGIKFLYKLVDE